MCPYIIKLVMTTIWPLRDFTREKQDIVRHATSWMDAFVQCRHYLCSNISICVLLASIFIFNIHLHIIIKGQTDICQQDEKQNIIFTQASHIKCKVASSLDTGSVWRLYWVRLLHIDLGLSVTILTFFTMMDSFQHLPAASLAPCLGSVSCL